jgi:probable addiction module antidote protein
MAKVASKVWDAAAHLESQEDMAAYLEAAFKEADPALIAAALGDIARAKGMSKSPAKLARPRELVQNTVTCACLMSSYPHFKSASA